MTDFPQKKTGWKRREAERKWQTIFGAFITLVLILAVFNGIYKSISFGKSVGKSSWDGEAPYATYINTEPPTVAVYKPDTKKIYFVTLDNKLHFETANEARPIESVNALNSSNETEKVLGAVSRITRTPINNYIIYNEKIEANKDSMEEIFKDFASISTPIKLATGGVSGLNTNMTRNDAFRLWWQIKSLSFNSLDYTNLASFSSEIITKDGDKVLGVDAISVHNFMSELLENDNLYESSESIIIDNASGIVEAGSLVNDFVTSVGAKVGNVNYSDQVVEKCSIGAKDEKSYVANYLEKLLICDINSVPSLGEGELRIEIGSEFAAKYIF